MLCKLGLVDTLFVLYGYRTWKGSGEIITQDKDIFMVVKFGNNSVALIYFWGNYKIPQRKVLWTVGMMALSLPDIVSEQLSYDS